MLDVFVKTNADSAERIATMLASGDVEEAQRMAHTLKGAAATLGMFHIQQLAAAVELPLKQSEENAVETARAALAELTLALQATITPLRQVQTEA